MPALILRVVDIGDQALIVPTKTELLKFISLTEEIQATIEGAMKN